MGKLIALLKVQTLIQDIRNITSLLQKVLFVHVSRQHNTLAHNLAQSELISGSMLWLQEFPFWITNLAQAESDFFVTQ